MDNTTRYVKMTCFRIYVCISNCLICVLLLLNNCEYSKVDCRVIGKTSGLLQNGDISTFLTSTVKVNGTNKTLAAHSATLGIIQLQNDGLSTSPTSRVKVNDTNKTLAASIATPGIMQLQNGGISTPPTNMVKVNGTNKTLAASSAIPGIRSKSKTLLPKSKASDSNAFQITSTRLTTLLLSGVCAACKRGASVCSTLACGSQENTNTFVGWSMAR